MKRSVLSVTLIVSLYPFLSSATPNSSTSIPTPEFESNLPRLELEHFSYIHANKSYFGKDEKESSVSKVGMEWKYRSRRGLFDMEAFYSDAEEQAHYNLRELNWTYEFGQMAVTAGRQLHDWSVTDHFWGMGFWEPRFYWDKMRPERNGLTGLFLSSRNWTDGWRGTLLLSPAFVPEMGPSYREERGRVVSGNPWFQASPPFVNLAGVETPLIANVIEPSVSDVLQSSSLALQIGKQISKSWDAYFSYGFKPINQVLISIEPYVIAAEDSNVFLEEASQVVANFYPEFPYHQIATFEASWKNGPWEIIPSVTHDNPQISERNPGYVSQMFDSATVTSVLAKYNRSQGLHRREFYSGYVRTFGAVAGDVGEFADVNAFKSLFEHRSRWFSAVRIGARETWPLRKGRGQWGQGFEVTYDFLQEGGLLLSELTYAPTSNVQFELKLDMIGPLNNKENEYQRGFVRTYRANDRFQLGMQYVF